MKYNKILKIYVVCQIYLLVIGTCMSSNILVDQDSVLLTTRNDENLHYIGSCETSYHSDGLYVKGDYAYITSWKDSGYYPPFNQYVGALDVINISDPQNPVIEGSCIYHDTGLRSLRQPCDIYLQENDQNYPFVYIVDSEQLTEDGEYYITGFNVSNTSYPLFDRNGNYDGKPYDIYCTENFAHVIGPNFGYQPFDIGSYWWDIYEFGDGYHESGHYYTDIVIRDQYAYITDSLTPPPPGDDGNDRISGSFKILDISDIEHPIAVASDGASDPQCLTIYESNLGYNYALVGCSNGLRLFNITEPLGVYDIGHLDHSNVLSVATSENLAYIANRSSVVAVDISNPNNPVLLDVYETNGEIMDIMAQDGYLYVTDAVQGLLILQYGEQQSPIIPSTPSGPNLGYAGEEYFFTTNTSDPQGQNIFYQWDWGDGNISEWLGPYPSGDSIETAHTWSQPSHYYYYEIRVRAKDPDGHNSEYSDPFLIYIEQAQDPVPDIQFGLVDGTGLTIIIENIGTADASDIRVNFSVDGGIIILPRNYSESLGTLSPNNGMESQFSILGIGLGIYTMIPKITITITGSNIESIETIRTARVFLKTIVLVDIPENMEV